MKLRWSRRGVLRAGAAAGVGLLGSRSAAALGAPAVHTRRAQGQRPLVISSANGLEACNRAMEMLEAGEDTLDSVIAGVNIVELDPEDTSVGYGGLPNEAGVVQLDSSVMHGPTRNGGAVACIEGIKTPSKVARLVMERTDHVLLVGKGAQDLGKGHKISPACTGSKSRTSSQSGPACGGWSGRRISPIATTGSHLREA